ncbi:MAG: hypothetical protein KDM63_21715, partial [Verrucomicrobiae bacterium]|nr:hypothetical protein [Verrucomicrobiae bacterium]
MKIQLALFSLVVLTIEPNARASESSLLFNRDIRPILSNACFQCHGPDQRERKGGFRLDL